jgi:hypothetical protein
VTLRATTPRDEAALAARARYVMLRAGGRTPDDLDLWRDVAMAAVLACDHAQPRPRGVPLFLGDQLHLRVNADGCAARLLCRVLARVQRRARG